MNANKEGIVIMTTGIAPGDIFKNQGNKDLAVKWLTEYFFISLLELNR